jgi:hypothetical protein
MRGRWSHTQSKRFACGKFIGFIGVLGLIIRSPDQVKGMNLVILTYNVILYSSLAYAALLGGKTGKAGAAIFFTANGLSISATHINPEWVGTAYAMLAVDTLCLLALIFLVFSSDRYWPIWAVGLQLVTVATHVTTIIDPDIVPASYDVIAGFWSIPILFIMVRGTILDRNAANRSTA